MASAVFVIVSFATCALAVGPPPRRHASVSTVELSMRARHSLSDVLMRTGSSSVVSVLDFGAVGDGITDNTDAFNKALAAVGAVGGGIVFAPTGQYRFNGSLNRFPPATSLLGSYQAPPSHNVGQGGLAPTDGTVLLPTAGRGNDSGAFITLNVDCTLRGVVVYYPDQLCSDTVAPVPYPWTVELGDGNNAAVLDSEFLNSWNAIRGVGSARHYVARVQGQPINIGISLDQVYDIGRLEKVHFNPWYCSKKTYMARQLSAGVAFQIARSDWESIIDCFVFGMSVGYRFIASSAGAMNGNIVACGADMCPTSSVVVEAADKYGLLFEGFEGTSFCDPNFGCDPSVVQSTQVVVDKGNDGAVLFTTSAFWGPGRMIANISGTGTVSFTQSTFVEWDHDGSGSGLPAVLVNSGNVVINGCVFQQAKGTQIHLTGPAVTRAVITSNVWAGAEAIVNDGAQNVQKGLNA